MMRKARARLAPTPWERADRGLLDRDPGRVELRQLGQVHCERSATLRCKRCKRRERFHSEFDIRDVFVRRDPLDLGQWQVVGPSAMHLPVVINLP
jgi:hypothetical protein